MNIVITINLNGNAYQLEKNGYDALREYLDNAAHRLEGNPDRDEIIADIEQAIADKFRAVLGANKTVVVAREVAGIIAEMGPVQDDSAPAGAPRADGTGPADAGKTRADGPAATADAGDGPAPGARRLYKINDGAMIAGVCNGLAAYCNIDVTVVRILFAVLTVFTWGVGLLLYVVMVLLVPAANTPAEKAAAFGGSPSTAEEFIRRAKKGYYEGMKTLNDKQTHREWKRRFKQEMRGWKQDFRREMSAHAHQWRYNWWQYRAQHPVPFPGMWLPGVVVALASVFLTVLGIYAILSLVATGVAFGVALPAGIPLWVGVVILVLALNFLLWPLRAARHFSHYSGWYGAGPHGPFAAMWHSVAWLAVLVLAVWFADRHVPQVHAALNQFRPQVHQALDSFRHWWAGR